MYDTILIPVDRSPFAERAVPHAVAIARKTGAQLHIVMVHALIGLDVVPRAPVTVETQFEHEIEREEKAYLDALAARIHDEHGLRVRTALLDGTVSRAIEGYIREHAVGLVVMSTHGHGGLRRAWLGSVADRLVRHINVPLLLIRPSGDAPPRSASHFRVLVAMDGSPIAEAALEHATSLFGSGAHATLLRVVVPPLGPQSPYIPDAARLNIEDVEHETALAQQYIATKMDLVRDRWLGVRTRVIASYHAADAILRAARTNEADLVVLGTHGRGPFVRAILGSVADKVVRGSDVPVLVFPAHGVEAANEPHRESRRVQEPTLL